MCEAFGHHLVHPLNFLIQRIDFLETCSHRAKTLPNLLCQQTNAWLKLQIIHVTHGSSHTTFLYFEPLQRSFARAAWVRVLVLLLQSVKDLFALNLL